MTAKRKAKKRTVTVWVWAVETSTGPTVGMDYTRSDARSSRETDIFDGYRVGPITRVEVPL